MAAPSNTNMTIKFILCFETLAGLMLGVHLNAATALTGSSTHLDTYTFPDSSVAANYNLISGTGTWTTTNALPDWSTSGSFAISGPLQGSGGTTNSISYDFTNMPGGTLPVGSYVYLADLDNGEVFTMTAYNSLGQIISKGWLSENLGGHGVGAGPGGSPLSTDMPGYDWNNTAASTYTFDGGTVVGNPSISLALETNQAIGRLDFSRTNNSNAFTIAAPVPEPSVVGLLAVGSLAFLRRNRKRGA